MNKERLRRCLMPLLVAGLVVAAAVNVAFVAAGQPGPGEQSLRRAEIHLTDTKEAARFGRPPCSASTQAVANTDPVELTQAP